MLIFACLYLTISGGAKNPISDPGTRYRTISEIDLQISPDKEGMIINIDSNSLLRKLRAKLPSRILICFSISLSFLLIVFLVGMERTNHVTGCQVIAGGILIFLSPVYQRSISVVPDPLNHLFLLKCRCWPFKNMQLYFENRSDLLSLSQPMSHLVIFWPTSLP